MGKVAFGIGEKSLGNDRAEDLFEADNCSVIVGMMMPSGGRLWGGRKRSWLQ